MNNRISRLMNSVVQNFMNFPGWTTRRKIVVFESDDWGSIRIPSKEVYRKFLAKGFDLSRTNYNRFDALECNEDLLQLFEVLNMFRDSSGNPPVFTSNFIVGNPDFSKIKESDFSEYFYEPVTNTLSHYPNREMVETLWKQGNSEGLFHPQFHGREHVNVVRWMDALKGKSPDIMFTFDHSTTFSGNGDYNFMEVLDYNSPDDLFEMKNSLQVGLDLFEKLFGYRSKSFIPPCYTWNSDIEKALGEGGVKYIQSLMVQSVPTGTFNKYRRKYHCLGNRNRFGQYFLIRNCFFEPSLFTSSDPVGDCLQRIEMAFRWNKPAIISSHRINYMGSIDERNRIENLFKLKELLKKIIRKHPDVEFLTSDTLGDLIELERRSWFR